MTTWDLNLGSGEARLGDEQILHVHPDDAGRVDLGLRRAIAGEAAFDIEYRLAATGGAPEWVSDRAVAPSATTRAGRRGCSGFAPTSPTASEFRRRSVKTRSG